MLLSRGSWLYSATDINNYLACEHLTQLERAVARGEATRPDRANPQGDILRRLGDAHETAYLEELRRRGVVATVIERPARGESPVAAAEATVAAMRRGDPLIYQAAFLHSGWFGYADFLRRVERPSALGSHAYEVADTKLARHSEPYFLLQLCNYSEHVERIQGVAPLTASLILGDGREETFDLADFTAHYRAVKGRFLRHVAEARPTRPYPVGYCDLCAFAERCAATLDAADSLARVANIRRVQTERLEAAGTTTLAALAASANDGPSTMARATFDTLKDQARLQFEQREAIARGDADPRRYRVLPRADVPTARGFELLPLRDPGDIFFDMEGDPYYNDGTTWFGGDSGLEYLFGAHTLDEGFVAFWGCDRGAGAPRHRRAERLAFEGFIDWLTERRARYPDFSIYHYGSYEQTAFKRLAERHRTREDHVDDLLRRGRMVDLYRVVRQGMRVGQPSYSIKKLEFYYEQRAREGTKAGDDSIVEFERWLALRAEGRPDDAILADIEQYNAFDCTSTAHLLDWLWGLRDAHPEVIAETPPEAAELADSTNERRAAIEAMRCRLSEALPADFDSAEVVRLADRDRLAWLFGEMLAFYEREAKPQWWSFHDACDTFAADPRDIIERNGAAIGGLVALGDDRYAYPPQVHKLEVDDAVFDLATRKPCGTIAELDPDRSDLVLRLKDDVPVPQAIIEGPKTHMSNSIVDALLRIAQRLLDGEPLAQRGPIADVLLARKPRFVPARDIVQPAMTDGTSILPLVRDLDDSALFIQGPPGSGKTQVGAELLVALISEGKRVGLTGPSYSAIRNLLDRVAIVAQQAGVTFSGLYKCGSKREAYAPGPGIPDGYMTSRTKVEPKPGVQLYAGTPWLFAGKAFSEAPEPLDVLFIDEAGQIELPKFVAATPSARNVVLLGDPAQLSQVAHTTHPGDVGLSVLSYLLAGEPTVAPDRGAFLTTTHRMHRDVCTFVSELSYRGRLREAPECNLQQIHSAGLSGAGLRALAVPHADNRTASPEEADRIAAEIELLLAGDVTDKTGTRRRMRPDDIIVVSPYNAQRTLLAERIGARAGNGIEVGTVNKFQGREAYVVFYSMATSGGEEMPRSTEFLFERNRLNVAVSRARAMAVLVYSPRLLEIETPSIDAMRLVNGLDRFLELAHPE